MGKHGLGQQSAPGQGSEPALAPGARLRGPPIWSPLFRSLAHTCNFVRYDERGCGLSNWDVQEDRLRDLRVGPGDGGRRSGPGTHRSMTLRLAFAQTPPAMLGDPARTHHLPAL